MDLGLVPRLRAAKHDAAGVRRIEADVAGLGEMAIRLALLAIMCTTAVGCSSVIPIGPPGPGCEKVPVHIALALDQVHMWGVDYADSSRIVAVQPRADLGWTIDPGPSPRLVDAVGREVGHGGDIFYQACFDPLTDTYYIGPEDLPNISPGA